MLTRPRFKYNFHVSVIEPDHVFLMHERSHFVLAGKAYVQLARLLDGQRTTEEILGSVDGQLPATEVLFAMDNLEKRGYLVEHDDTFTEGEAAFWNYLDLDSATASARLAERPVALHALGALQTAPLAEALASLHVRTDDAADFRVVLADDYLQEDLEALNAAALESGKAWMLIKPVGAVPWVGPIFRPGSTACWGCLAQRLRANRQVEAHVQRHGGGGAPLATSRAQLPSTVALTLNLAATEIAKYRVTESNKALEGRLVTLDLLTLDKQDHVVVRRPQCPACGDAGLRSAREPEPPRLEPRPKRFTAEAGHRTVTPTETYERYRHHVSPLTGAVTTLTRLDGGETGLAYNYAAGHNFAMGVDDVFSLALNLRGRSGGKGASDTQARVSGLCEAIERYSGVFRGDEYRVRATFEALGETAIHPNECMLFSETQYRDRQAWNAAQPRTKRHIVPDPFDTGREMDWVPAWSLTQQRQRHIPAAAVYYGHPEGRNPFSVMADSNGSAAGNTLEEAILQGFMELVERDTVAMWWYNRVQRPAVDLTSFELPYLEALQQFYARMGREIWAIDLTNDLGIPSFAGVSRCTDRRVEDVLVGFGAHFDPRVALLRAMTEVNQFLPAVRNKDPQGNTRYWFPDEEAIQWWTQATLKSDPYLSPDPGAAPRKMSDFQRHDTDDLKQDVERCAELTARAGLDMLVVDQTQPDIGLSVVKVIVPTIRHFWRRLAPGRLYDVPAKLGWVERPLTEDQVNPRNIFF